MSIFDRRPGLRWAVPAGAAVLVVGGAALTPLAATADSGLEPRTAEELLVALAQPSATAVSGTVVTSAELGLPDLPLGMMPNSGPMALASGQNTLRVWTDGPQRQRLAMIERAAETTVVRNGQEAWVWSSADATADRYALPEEGSSGAMGQGLDGSELPPGVELPSTPQEAAAMALEAIDPTTEVTTSGVGTVAGRDAYELVLTPRDPLDPGRARDAVDGRRDQCAAAGARVLHVRSRTRPSRWASAPWTTPPLTRRCSSSPRRPARRSPSIRRQGGRAARLRATRPTGAAGPEPTVVGDGLERGCDRRTAGRRARQPRRGRDARDAARRATAAR